MKILVTGGTGFFGKSIIDAVRRGRLENHEFVMMSRHPDKFIAACPQLAAVKGVRFIAGDVRYFAFPDEPFDAVIHAATPALTTISDAEMRDIINAGAARVCQYMKSCLPHGRLLFCSSGAVYGVQPPEIERLPEDFPCQPVTAYGQGKLDSERLFLEHGIDVATARCFAFVGRYLARDIHFAIGNFMRDCLAGTPITIRGDGTPYRSYLYADDLIDWLFAVLEHGRSGRVYNVGSDDGMPIRRLAERVRDALASQSVIEVLGTPRPGTPPSRYVPDTTRIRTELGVSLKIPFETAVRLSCAD
ncbi:MAG: NAD(P)-dependent oxidoreductase [Victivallaceae bacterium]|nr:NAD(P)-dependent oxidoreductase [Victivallaceae bacterium]